MRSYRPILAAFACLLVVSGFAQTTLYWDTNGATAGSSAGTTATGTWSLGSNWSTSADGTIATQGWTDGSNAVFSAGTNATGTYTVDTGSNPTVAQLSFNLGNVTVHDNSVRITQGVDVASGSFGTIDSQLWLASNFTKSGSGTLTLAKSVTWIDHPVTSINLSGGQIAFTGGNDMSIATLAIAGEVGTRFTVSNGATMMPVTRLELDGAVTLEIGAGGTLLLDTGVKVGSGTPTFALSGGTVTGAGTIDPLVTLSSGTSSTFLLTNVFDHLALAGGVSGAGAINKTGPGTLTLNGDNAGFSGGTTITAGTLALGHAGALGTGPLTFAGGNLLVQGVSPTVTPFVIQNGSATVTGSGTVLTSATYAEVGSGGTGVLNISSGGTVSAAASAVAGIGLSGNGTIAVDGTGSQLNVGTFFVAGYASDTTGTLALTNSGAATIGQYALIGYNGTGSLSLASGASFATTQDLNLGFAATGAGTLTVSGGGTVTTGANAYIGYAGNSAATVSGANSAWNVASTLSTGFGATGSLTIGSGGAVTADSVDLARNSGSTGTINVNSGGTLSLGGLTQGAGSATLNLAGGTLGIVNRSFTTSVPLALADNTTSSLSVSGLAVQFDGVISGGGALAKDGAGIVTLNAANTYSGGTTLNAGTLALANASALGSSSAALTLNGGSLDLGGFNPTTGTVVFNGGTFTNGTLANASGFEVRTGSLSAALTGGGALTKTGAGTFTLSGANTYTGATTVSAGTLALGTATTLGSTASVTVAPGATLALNNLTVALTSLGGTGTVDVGSGDLQFGTAGDQTLAVSLTGSGTLTKVGSGTLTLAGTNAHTGGTRVQAGLIEFGSLAAFPSAVSLDGGGLRWATGTSADVSSVGLTFGSSGGTLDTNGSDVTLSSAVGGTGGFNKTGAGTLTLDAANNYPGVTTVSSGTLHLGLASALATTSGVNIDSAGTLDVNNLTATISAIGGSGTLALGSGILTTGTAANQTFSGAITGTGSLTKIGSGTLTLTGPNIHTGGFTLNAGLLEFGSLANLGSGLVTLDGGGLRWATGSTTDVSARLAALGANGGTFDTNGNNLTFANALSGSGAVTKSGTGTLAFTGANTHAGGTRITGGSIEFSSLAAFGSGLVTLDGGGLRWASGTTTDVSSRLATLGAAGGTFDTNGNNVAFANALTATNNMTKLGTGTLTLSGANTAGHGFVQAGTLALSGAGSSFTTGSYIEVGDPSGDATLSLAAGSHITSAGTTAVGVGAGRTASLTIDGAGSELTANGALFLGHTGTGIASVSNGGRLTSPASITVGYLPGSSGQLTISGGGVVSTAGSVTLGDEFINRFPIGENVLSSGSATVTGSGSRLEAGANLVIGNLGSGTLTIAAGGTVTVGGFAQLGGAFTTTNFLGQPVTAAIGSGTLNLESGGTLTIGGTDAFRRSSYTINIVGSQGTVFSDHFNLAGGTLQVTGSALTTVVPATLTNTSTIDTNSLGATFSGVLSGAGSLTKTGAGTLTLSAANTYTGATTINAGTLALGAGGSLASSSIHLASGATFDPTAAGGFTLGAGHSLSGSGTVGGLFTIASGAHLAPGNSPGTITFTNGLTLNDGAVLDFQLGTISDLIDVTGGTLTGPASIGGVTINFSDSGGFAAGTYTLINYATASGTASFGADRFALGSTIAGYTYAFTDTGSALQVIVGAASAIPEPATYAMFAGLMALGLASFRRRFCACGIRSTTR